MAPEILFSFVGLIFQIINPAKNLVNSISNIQNRIFKNEKLQQNVLWKSKCLSKEQTLSKSIL